ncbi:GPI ethanolamine phosphate transferase 2 [Aphidius gifuensis]|uniref:GPI ethanolamine phosphate transferase 2 n=1 Tax=Aphidius gifuensis TaxID=684658 RepID=UPI001CDB94C6|nr:GPI ethanolamine phosphate transferase 2 [Aphidius gifuensis]
MYGFFPIKITNNLPSNYNDIPDIINNIKLDKNELYKPSVQKIIIMVIDALRWDFVDVNKMPITSNLINNNKAHLLKVKVNAPTVTMPRIKAMTTGMLPNFIDVVLNLGKSEVQSDSILHQAQKNNHKLVFYGDDTWLKLFPNIFHRHDGTTSFFVTDFTEVDDNVTRQIDKELYDNNDWSIMILHYLGLDHIGHVFGPHHNLITQKLHEMDNIIYKLNNKINQFNDNNISSLLIVCGDHGMKDSGGHGGATPEETLVPFVVFGNNYQKNIHHNYYNEIDQIDIATTLAVLLGLPIPSSNIGTVSMNIIKNYSTKQQLFILYYNAKQIYLHFKKIDDYKFSKIHDNYNEAIKLHYNLLNNNQENEIVDSQANYIIHKYYEILQQMKAILVKSTIKYDLTIMTFSIILIIQYFVLIIINSSMKNNNFSIKIFILTLFLSGIFWFVLIICLNNANIDNIYSDFIDIPNFLKLIIISLIIFNCYLLSKSISNNFQLNITNVSFVGIFLYIASLTSSSFIEEEHQIWYFFYTTFLIYTMYYHVKKINYHLADINGDNLIILILTLAIVHRIFRKLNSTGNKYAHLPDIKNWLEANDSNITMTLLLIASLLILITISYITERKKYKATTLIFNLILACCIYQRHASSNNYVINFLHLKSQGIYEVYLFWMAISLLLIYRINKTLNLQNNNKLFRQIIFIFIEVLIMISALLHRPHNVIILPVQIVTSIVIHKYITNDTNCIFISYLIGNVYYFYQGNSNSLATIDVAAGYVGLTSYNPIIATIYLSINTFSSRIIEYLILIYIKTINNNNEYSSMIINLNQQCLVIHFLPFLFYTIIISMQRYHLFIWTVFSPKILYESFHCAIFFIAIFIVQSILILIENNMKKKMNKYVY